MAIHCAAAEWVRLINENVLENVAIANALQLEAARATPALCRFNYDAMPMKSLNLSIAVYSISAADALL